jgi:hexosaminidase
VEYATSRYIKVIPEIDIPGHSMAILASYPELSCTEEPFEVPYRFKIYKDVLCSGKEEVFTFLENIFDEIIELFPSKLVHIGGDEVPKARWKKCDNCQERMKKEGLKDENQLQTYFINRIIKYLHDKNRSAIVWNDILSPELDKNAIIQHWKPGGLKKLDYVRSKRRFIMSNFFRVYLNYDYVVTPLRKTYNYNLIPKGLEKEFHKNILGVETCMWTQWFKDFYNLQLYTFPRLIAVAELGWSYDEDKKLKSFKDRLSHINNRLEALGVNYMDLNKTDPSFLKRIFMLFHILLGSKNYSPISNK